MAQVYLQDEEDKKNNPAPTVSGGQAASITNAANPQQPQQKTAGSGRFANLQKFVGANQQAPKEYEQKISGKIAGQAEGLKQQTQQKFNQANQLGQSEQQRLNNSQNLISQIPTNVLGLTSDQNKLAELDKIRENQFSRDINLGDTQKLQQGIGELAGTAGLTESIEGRKQLLKDVYNQNNPQNYGSGASRLDQLLLQADPTSAGRLINQARTNLTDTQGGFTTAQNQINELQKNIESLSSQRQKQFNEVLGQGLGKIKSDVEGRASQYQNRLNSNVDILNKALSSGEINRQDYNQLDPEFKAQIDSIIGKSMTDIGGSSISAINPQTNINRFATKQEQAQQRALERLANQSSSFLAGDVTGADPNDLSLGDIAGLSEFIGKRNERERQLQAERDARTASAKAAKDAERQAQIQKLNEVYYNQLGQHSGQGWDRARDTTGIYGELLDSGENLFDIHEVANPFAGINFGGLTTNNATQNLWAPVGQDYASINIPGIEQQPANTVAQRFFNDYVSNYTDAGIDRGRSVQHETNRQLDAARASLAEKQAAIEAAAVDPRFGNLFRLVG